MAIQYPVYNFPTFSVWKQLFHVPGAAADGGYTSGGARITSPEPGGFAALEIQPALQLNEFSYPLCSWLMSKTNGEILRVRLAPTPQIASYVAGTVPWDTDQPWNNNEPWIGDYTASYSATALPGSNVFKVDMALLGPILKQGHVIGHMNSCYKIDDISYDNTGLATITVKPPIRKSVTIGDPVYFRPWFTGMITNPNDMRQTYDAEMNGAIQLGNIILSEVVL